MDGASQLPVDDSDSDFYGDQEEVRELTEQVARFDSERLWRRIQRLHGLTAPPTPAMPRPEDASVIVKTEPQGQLPLTGVKIKPEPELDPVVKLESDAQGGPAPAIVKIEANPGSDRLPAIVKTETEQPVGGLSRHGVASSDVYSAKTILCNLVQATKTTAEYMKMVPQRTAVVSAEPDCILIRGPGYDEVLQHLNREVPNHPTINKNGQSAPKTSLYRFFCIGALERLLIDRRYLDSMAPAALKEPGDKAASSCVRSFLEDRDLTRSDLLKFAVKLEFTQGKWILYPAPGDINDCWRVIAEATRAGHLGIAASAPPATAPNSSEGAVGSPEPCQKQRIFVHSRDYTNIEDVKRILGKLRQLGVTCANADTRSTAVYLPRALSFFGDFTRMREGSDPYIYKSSDFPAVA